MKGYMTVKNPVLSKLISQEESFNTTEKIHNVDKFFASKYCDIFSPNQQT